MNLDDYVAKHPPRTGGTGCAVCDLPVDIRLTVNTAKGKYPASSIVAWLNEDQGFNVKKSTVALHLREHLDRG